MTVVVMLPLKSVSEPNHRGHWAIRARRSREFRHVAKAMVLAHPLPCIVTLTRYSPGTLDDDNLRGALKAIRDGVADKLGVPDNDPRIEWRYAQAKAKRGEFGVQISIEAKP